MGLYDNGARERKHNWKRNGRGVALGLRRPILHGHVLANLCRFGVRSPHPLLARRLGRRGVCQSAPSKPCVSNMAVLGNPLVAHAMQRCIRRR